MCLTFDMRGGPRLYAARPLDGMVGPRRLRSAIDTPSAKAFHAQLQTGGGTAGSLRSVSGFAGGS